MEGDDYGERAEREPLRGSGGGAPSGVQGQSPWWGSGAKPPEAVDILRSRSMKFALEMHDFPICITVQIFVIMQYYDWFYRLSIHEE